LSLLLQIVAAFTPLTIVVGATPSSPRLHELDAIPCSLLDSVPSTDTRQNVDHQTVCGVELATGSLRFACAFMPLAHILVAQPASTHWVLSVVCRSNA